MFYCGPSSRDIARSMRSRDPESGPSSSGIARSMRSRDSGSCNCLVCLIILGTVFLGGGISLFLINVFTFGVVLLALGCLLWVSSCLFVCWTHCGRHCAGASRTTRSHPKMLSPYHQRLPVDQGLPVQQRSPILQRLPVDLGNNFTGNALDQRRNLLLRQEPVSTPVPTVTHPSESPGSSASDATGHNKYPFHMTQVSRCKNPAPIADNVNSIAASSTVGTMSASGTHNPQTDSSPSSPHGGTSMLPSD